MNKNRARLIRMTWEAFTAKERENIQPGFDGAWKSELRIDGTPYETFEEWGQDHIFWIDDKGNIYAEQKL